MPFFSRKPLIVCAQALQLIPSTFQLTVSMLFHQNGGCKFTEFRPYRFHHIKQAEGYLC
jgi:uncharacterized protein (DUF779 family)